MVVEEPFGDLASVALVMFSLWCKPAKIAIVGKVSSVGTMFGVRRFPLRSEPTSQKPSVIPHSQMPNAPSLYDRLGGYDAVSAVANNLLPRLISDDQLGRFWEHRGTDGLDREKQLLIDFLCHNAGGPIYYTGRDMTLTHRGMRISDADWTRFIGHLKDTLDHFDLPDAERNDVLGFIESTKAEIVEA